MLRTESFDILGVANSVTPSSNIEIVATTQSGEKIKFQVLCRIDTGIENEYYRNGGLLTYVLRQMIKESNSS